MSTPEEQAAKQLARIVQETGNTVADWAKILDASGFEKHGQRVKHLKETHGLGHGDANLVVVRVREAAEGGPPPADDLLEAQYAGAKAHLRPIHDALVAVGTGFGGDVEVVVQKTGVSLRRKKQFALVQAPSSKRVQLGLNLDDTPSSDRISEAKGMCTHRVDLTDADEVDDDVTAWLHAAYERAG